MSGWCRDIPRDEAVRASEDGRSGPLPTLEEAIERQKHAAMTAGVKEGFVKADGEWKRLTDDELRQLLMIPKSVSASSAVEPESKGDSMATNGLRTERVTLEITMPDGGRKYHGNASSWDWRKILRSAQNFFGPGESVRVVEEEIRPAPQSRPAETRQTQAERIGGGWWFPKNDLPSPPPPPPPPPPPAPPRVHCGSGVFDANGDEVPWEGVVAALKAERDAAIRERDEHKARVADLESAAKLAPAANAGAGSNHTAQAASGAAGTEPDYYVYKNERGRIVYTSQKLVGDEWAAWTITPLYAAPQPARGWLTEDERKTLSETADVLDDRKAHAYARFVCDLLARSSPPEVVLPRECDGLRYDSFVAGWNGYRDEALKALAAAGVKVKEVGRE